MDMPGASAPPPEKTLAETLCQCVKELEKKNLTIACVQGAATEPARMFPPFEYLNRGSEACFSLSISPSLHHERGLKCNSPRVTNEKMGPRQGGVGKQRQQRQTCKGTMKVYSVDVSNFRALVDEHTSQRSSSPPPDVAAQPSSPLTPHSGASTSSVWGFMSQPSSPTTPHSTRSSSPSPLSSPHQGHPNGGLYLNALHRPLAAHAEYSPQLNTHLNIPHPHPLLSNGSQNFIPNHNTNIHQSIYVPRCASAPCMGISSEAENVPYNDRQQQALSPAQYARALSLERFLLAENVPSNESQPQVISPAQYERLLSLERLLLAEHVPSKDGRSQGVSPAQYARALSLERSLSYDDDAVYNSNHM